MASEADTLRVEEEVRAASEEVIRRERAKDFDKVSGFYAPDATLQAAGMPQLDGRQAILGGYKEFFSTVSDIEGGPTKVVVAASGDVALELGWNCITMHTPEGAAEVVGKYSRGWVRTGTQWLIQLQTYSPDM